MKVSELKRGMLLEGDGNSRLRVVPCSVTWGPGVPMLQATWPSKYDKGKYFVRCVMYLGTREELNMTKSDWGRRYALVDGKTMLIDRESWRYIKPVQGKINANTI